MEKILISAGIVLSLGGVWVMLRASIYKDPKTGKRWAHRHDPIQWMLKWGWVCLILGVITQLIGTWFPQLVAKNLPQQSEMSWETMKLIMETQDKLATYGLIILGIVVAAMVLTNIFILTYPDRKIKETREELEKKIEAYSKKYLEQSKAEIQKAEQSLETKIMTANKDAQAETHVVIAYLLDQTKLYVVEAIALSEAAKLFNELNKIDRLKTILIALRTCVERKNFKPHKIGWISRIENNISAISELSSDKEAILERLQTFRVK